MLLALLCAAILTSVWVYCLPLGRVARGQNDFLAFYAGAKLAGTPELYSAEAAKQWQAKVADIWLPAVVYIRPPFYAAMLKPLAALPYRAAYAVFQALNLAALASFLWMHARRDPLLLTLGGASIPVATAFANGQDILLMIWILAAARALERRKKHFWAGLLLSLLAIKFHIFVFVPLVMLAGKRWSMLAGSALGGSVLFGVACALQGWNWAPGYLRFLETPQITPTPMTMPNLRGLAMALAGDGSRAAGVLELALAAAVTLALLYVLRKSRDFGASLAAAVVAGLLIGRHAYVQDCCLLLLVPALAPALAKSRTVALAALAPPVYFLLLANSAVSVLAPLSLLCLFGTIAFETVSEGASAGVQLVRGRAMNIIETRGVPRPL